MEQIVLLDSQDDVASVRSKLHNLRPGKAAIVVPDNNRVLRGPIAMRIIRRQAIDLALDLAVISESPAIRDAAHQQGFAVYGSERGYQRALARAATRSRKTPGRLAPLWRGAGATATLAILASISLVAIAAGYILLPRTSVTLVPVSQRIEEQLQIVANPEAKAVDVENRTVPARVVYIKAQGSEQLPATGREDSTSAKAEGKVTFTNRTEQEVVVPPGSIVRTTDNVRFTTLEEAKLAPGSQGVARVPIAAAEAGEKGNVDRGRITRIEGGLEMQVTVFNEEPTTGGGSKEVEVVTEEDRVKVKENLQRKLEEEAIRKLEAERQRHETLSTQSIRVVPLREDYDKDVGDLSKVVNLEMEVRANGTFYNTADVESVIKSWSPRLKPGYYLQAETIQASEPRIVEAEGGVARIVVDISGTVSSRINEDRIADAVRWKTVEEATKYLNDNLILATEPEISIDPDWAGRALRVQVVVVNTAPSDGGQ